MKQKKYGKKCVICGVSNKGGSAQSGIFLAKFPLDPDRCRLWVRATGIEDLAYIPIIKLNENRYICGDHFPHNMFNKNRTRLHSKAIPTINLINPPLTDDILESFPLPVSSCHLKKAITHPPATKSLEDNAPNLKKDLSADSSPTSKSNDENVAHNEELHLSKNHEKAITHPPATKPLEGNAPNFKKDFSAGSSPSSKSNDENVIQNELIYLLAANIHTHAAKPCGDKAPKSKKRKKDLSAYCPPTCKLNDEVVTQNEEQLHLSKKVDYPYTDGDIVVLASEDNILHINIPEVEEEIQLEDHVDSPASTETFHITIPHVGEEIQLDDHDYVHNESISSEMSHRKKKEKEIKKLPLTRDLLKTLNLFNSDNAGSDCIKDIVDQAAKNLARRPKGARWDIKTKIACLQIFKRSPSVYHRLHRNITMPSVRTVLRILQTLTIEPGINPALLTQLRDKSKTMLPETKLCTLIFSEISLKRQLLYNENTDKVEGFVDYGPGEGRGRRNELADKCLVFMIQGIRKKYKQPLAFYFVEGAVSADLLSSLISKSIQVLEEATFTVVATVCNHRAGNCAALSQLKQNSRLLADANYFFVNNRKIYIIFDVPHLFISLRNNFLEAGTMEMDGKCAKWQHLRDAEELNRRLLHLHKIAPALLNPKPKMKRKFKYAAQTLSNTFAAILRMMALKHNGTEYGLEIEQTSDVIRDLNNLLDITNGPMNSTDVVKGYRQNVSGKSNHVYAWNAFLKKVRTINFLKNDRRLQLSKVRCVQGFITTIKSLKDIWYEFQNQDFTSLQLRQFNQDSLDNLFSVVRKSSSANRIPTCTHFASAIKTVLVSKHDRKRRAYWDNDTNKLLFKMSLKTEPVGNNNALSSIGIIDDIDGHPITTAETLKDEQIEKRLAETKNQPLIYLSSYIAFRILKGNHCQTCFGLLQEGMVDHLEKYISLRQWWKTIKHTLRYPTNHLNRTTEEAIVCFNSNIHLFHEERVIQKFCSLMMTQINFEWWTCNTHHYLRSRIIRLIVKILIRKECMKYNDYFTMA